MSDVAAALAIVSSARRSPVGPICQEIDHPAPVDGSGRGAKFPRVTVERYGQVMFTSGEVVPGLRQMVGLATPQPCAGQGGPRRENGGNLQ
jgi:hypothetical protein